jgi:peptidoglycan-associated lipoprotein
MKGYKQILLMACFLSTFFFGCQRSASQVWEDTKTGGNYLGKSVRSAAGKHGSSKQVQSEREFVAQSTYQQDFIPLNDDDLYQKIALGDPEALKQINAYTPIPQPKESPGDLGSKIPGIEAFSSPDQLNLQSVFKVIYFDTNDYVVRGGDIRKDLRSVSNYLKDNPQVSVFIIGNCDERGTAAYNLSLGSKRSNSVRAMLVKEGVDLNRLHTISYGKERPISTGHGSSDWKLNRRVNFKLYSSR